MSRNRFSDMLSPGDSALRFHERQGLIRSRRTAGNQRRYRREVLRYVAFEQCALVNPGDELGRNGPGPYRLFDARAPPRRGLAVARRRRRGSSRLLRRLLRPRGVRP